MDPDDGWLVSPISWVVDLLVDTDRRTRILLHLAYLAAIAGLGITALEGAFDPTSSAGALGVALLGVSFLAFFVASLLLITPGTGRE